LLDTFRAVNVTARCAALMTDGTVFPRHLLRTLLAATRADLEAAEFLARTILFDPRG